LSARLESEETKRHQFEEIYVSCKKRDALRFRNHMRLDERCSDDYADRLKEKRDGEGPSCLGIYKSGIREKEAAAEEAKYGGQRFDPAVWMV